MTVKNHVTNFRTFGYLPTGNHAEDRVAKRIGVQNLIKRLQARDLMQALDLSAEDRVLDMGCGQGYITVEMARIAKEAHGIDTGEYMDLLMVPTELEGRLFFRRGSGEALPYQDDFFDTVLASEVLPMVPDPAGFLAEIRRVLKPGGKLVVLNGLGHPSIKEALERNSRRIRWLRRRYPERMPKDYDDYVERLQRSFGTSLKAFMSRQAIEDALREHGFIIVEAGYTPKHVAGSFFSWNQFLMYLTAGKTFPITGYLWKYALLNVLSRLPGRRWEGGYLCVAHKRGAGDADRQ